MYLINHKAQKVYGDLNDITDELKEKITHIASGVFRINKIKNENNGNCLIISIHDYYCSMNEKKNPKLMKGYVNAYDKNTKKMRKSFHYWVEKDNDIVYTQYLDGVTRIKKDDYYNQTKPEDIEIMEKNWIDEQMNNCLNSYYEICEEYFDEI
jgi:hypothetical protein